MLEYNQVIERYTLPNNGYDSQNGHNSCFFIAVNAQGRFNTTRDRLGAAWLGVGGRNQDYMDLITPGKTVDAYTAGVATARLTNQNVVIITENAVISISPNGNAEVLLGPDQIHAALDNQNIAIAYNNGHFTAIMHDQRENFANAYCAHRERHVLTQSHLSDRNATEIAQTNRNATEQDRIDPAIEQTNRNAENPNYMNMATALGILKDAINCNFSSRNCQAALETVQEILNATGEENLRPMVTMLIHGIAAQAEHDKHADLGSSVPDASPVDSSVPDVSSLGSSVYAKFLDSEQKSQTQSKHESQMPNEPADSRVSSQQSR